MTLEEWREAKGWTYAQLAEKVGAAHPVVVRRWCVGEGVPSLEFKNAVQEATGGAVRANSWVEVVAPAKPKRKKSKAGKLR